MPDIYPTLTLLGAEDEAAMLDVLAIVLLLGEVKVAAAGAEGASVEGDVSKLVALLGCDKAALEAAVTNNTRVVGGTSSCYYYVYRLS